MRIIGTRAYEGKNIYFYGPVIRMILDLEEYTDQTSDQLVGFSKALIELLPSLKEHHCSKGVSGGFIQRLKEGTLLGHIIEHVSLELQNLAGAKVNYGKTRGTDKKGIYEIVYEFEVKESGLLAGQRAFDIVRGILAKKEINLQAIVDDIRTCNTKWGLGPSTKAIVTAARKRNIPVIPLDDNCLIQLGYGKNQKRIGATITQHTSCLGVDIASDKALTKELLKEAGISVPKGFIMRNIKELKDTAEKLQKPVVIKPFNGNHGKGVTTNITNYNEMERAFGLAQNFSEKVIIEEHIQGHQYRLLVVGSSVIAAAKRIPPFIIGDGTHTIKELVEIVNSDPRRGDGHEKCLTKVRLDSIAIINLAKLKLSPASILPTGQKINLRDSANLSTGASSIDVTDKIHPYNRELAVRAARIIGLDVAGIDIITNDIEVPIKEGAGAIIEVNAAPGLRMHLYPEEGEARPCGEAIIDHLFKGSDSRIPLVSVTGTNGKTTTVRLISNILSAKGLKVGMTTTDGIYIGKNLIVSGDMAGPKSARAILKDPTVEAVVLETARGGLLRGGLGYDQSDVGIITNISSDHLGQDGINTLEDLAYVKALVAETVSKTGYAILNADDKQVMNLLHRVVSKTIYFSSCSNNFYIKRNLGAGGKAVFLKRGNIIFAEGNKVEKIANVREIPITLNGLASHNIQNVLAATAAALALGVELEHIRKGLTSFELSVQDNPGRLNIFELKGYKIVVDYGHNEAAYKNTIALLKKMGSKRLIGIIGAPGDRPDENIVEVGRISGRGFDKVFIKEDQDLRGRRPGEVAELLKKGLLKAGLKQDQMQIIYNEREALLMALGFAQPNDLIVIFYEKLRPLLSIIELEIRKSMKKSVTIKREKAAVERNIIV